MCTFWHYLFLEKLLDFGSLLRSPLEETLEVSLSNSIVLLRQKELNAEAPVQKAWSTVSGLSSLIIVEALIPT